MLRTVGLIPTLLIPAFWSTQAHGQSFIADTSFSADGVIIQEEEGGTRWTTDAMAIASDGGVITSSSISRDGVFSIGVSRYTSAGEPITGFGVNGVLEFAIAANSHAVIERPEGLIDVVCTAHLPGGILELKIYQLLPDGTLDMTWGDQGIARFEFPGGSNLMDMVERASGELVLGGGIAGDMVAVQFNSAGQLDLSFGVNGIAALSLPGRSIMALDMELAPNGAVYLGGYRTQGFDATAWAFGALNASGTPLAGFGTNGVVVIDNVPDNVSSPSNTQEHVSAIALDAENNMYFGAALAFTYGNEHGAIGRLTPTGTLDTTFGTNGLLVFRPDTTRRVSFSGIFLDPVGQVIGVAQECQGGGCKKLFLRTDLAGNILDPHINGGFTRDLSPIPQTNYATGYTCERTPQGRLFFASPFSGPDYTRSAIKAFVLNDELTTGLPLTAPESSMYVLAPNPCTGSFALLAMGSITPLSALRLFDAQGALVADYSGQVNTTGQSATTSFQLPSHRAAGLYQVVLDTSTGRTVLHLVVE